MSRNSSKSQLFLMEFICVVMFFALCAALCIHVFVQADRISKEGRQLNEALLLAQSVAETIKNMDYSDKEEINTTVNQINKEYKNKYTVRVKDAVKENILQANIYVYSMKDKKEICTLSIKKYLPGEV